MARNLVLVGFMGSGKTAVGRRAAALLSLPLVDIDDVVVERAGKSIVDIFDESGEAGFRRLETAALKEVLGRQDQVVTPGGGAVINDDNWRRVRDRNLVVYLSASPRALLRRIRSRESGRTAAGRRPANIRPLADVGPDAPRWPSTARARVMELMWARLPRYSEATIKVDTTGREVADVAREVARLARAAGLGR